MAPHEEHYLTGIPHVFTTLFIIIILAAMLTWIVPSGRFERVSAVSGEASIQAGSYEKVEGRRFGPMMTVTAVYRGMVQAADIVFFVFISFASISVTVKTGAFHALIATLLRRFKGERQVLVIPLFIALIGSLSSTVGVFEEMFPFIPIFVGVAMAMRFDAIVGMSIVALGIGLGYSGAALNPFTVGVAQNIAGLAPFSGAGYRVFCHLLMIWVSSSYVMAYAARVANHPESSYVADVDIRGAQFDRHAIAELIISRRQWLVLLIIVTGLVTISWGMRTQGWYSQEIASVYLFMAVGSGLAMGWSPDRISHHWADSATEITSTCLKIAVAKGVIMILTEAEILDTIIHWFSGPLSNMPQWFAAESMLVLQTLLNFFVPSGPGQAVISMPFMIPISDVLGISRQTAVLAFQFGDGLSNVLWLTGSMPIICKFAKVPPRKWIRFFFPLFCLLFFTQMVCIAIALTVGY